MDTGGGDDSVYSLVPYPEGGDNADQIQLGPGDDAVNIADGTHGQDTFNATGGPGRDSLTIRAEAGHTRARFALRR